jgi:hypothetical protein
VDKAAVKGLMHTPRAGSRSPPNTGGSHALLDSWDTALAIDQFTSGGGTGDVPRDGTATSTVFGASKGPSTISFPVMVVRVGTGRAAKGTPASSNACCHPA